MRTFGWNPTEGELQVISFFILFGLRSEVDFENKHRFELHLRNLLKGHYKLCLLLAGWSLQILSTGQSL